MKAQNKIDVIVVGGGISGLSTAMRLQAKGLSTMVLEAHTRLGGCAGFYRDNGFAFDVGATTLVDFSRGGIGGDFLEHVGLQPLDDDLLPGYKAWLPDCEIELHRDAALWHTERLAKLGSTPQHHAFWRELDRIAQSFWPAARKGLTLPMQSIFDLLSNARCLPLQDWPLVRHLGQTMGDALHKHGLQNEARLCGLLSMLVEDTVHAQLMEAPLINSALGITIRGSGLCVSKGGMHGFFKRLTQRYIELGGVLKFRTKVGEVRQDNEQYLVVSGSKTWTAHHVVLAIPAQQAACITPSIVKRKLKPYLERDESQLGGGIVVFVASEESKVTHETWRHHQLLQNYNTPLGYGNNMFISVSRCDDLACAPTGKVAVVLSTHCPIEDWEGLSDSQYQNKKAAITAQLLRYAHRVYPKLGLGADRVITGTPKSYAHFANRYRGSVGGVRQTLGNSNQNAIPYSLGMSNLWLVGDSTWPGLGTVANLIGSKAVSEKIFRSYK